MLKTRDEEAIDTQTSFKSLNSTSIRRGLMALITARSLFSLGMDDHRLWWIVSGMNATASNDASPAMAVWSQ